MTVGNCSVFFKWLIKDRCINWGTSPVELGHGVTAPMPNTHLIALIEAISWENLASSLPRGLSSVAGSFSAFPDGVQEEAPPQSLPVLPTVPWVNIHPW